MLKRLIILAGLFGVSMLSACGGENRADLARQTVKTYWNKIDHGKWKDAYYMLTPGEQATIPLDQYQKQWVEFLAKTAGVTAVVGTPYVKNDCANVPVTLKSPESFRNDLHARQDLFWNNGKWQISDENGALTNRTSAGCV